MGEAHTSPVYYFDDLIQNDKCSLLQQLALEAIWMLSRTLTCKLASSTRVSTARAYVSRDRCTCCPPLPRPVKPKSFVFSAITLSNCGSRTPETFSCFVRTRKRADFADSWIWKPISPPTAYVTSAREKAAICITRPIFLFASSIRLVISMSG